MTDTASGLSGGEPQSTRRSFMRLAGAGTALAMGASVPVGASAADCPAASPTPVSAVGAHQAGVARPATPQPHQVVAVYDVHGDIAIARTLLATMGRRIIDIARARSAAMLGMAPGDVTVTVGVGPRLVQAVDARLPGARGLPEFARERMTERDRGGDLLVQVCGSDPVVASVALAAVASHGALRERWRQSAARGTPVALPNGQNAARNVMGFIDGIVAPHGPLESSAEVWIPAPAEVRGATIAVVRRMEIDLASFAGRTVAQQEVVVGRRRTSGAPLSGGSVLAAPDLGVLTPNGRYLVPLHSHVRRAHSAATGVARMLRRSYSMSAPAGLLFVSYQRDLHTFIATMNRMQAGDDLFDLTTTTATGSFLVLPGFDESHPLGSTLFD